ncbi:MAG TPA: zinc-binding dehydrogenase [Acidimicrobiales bacterium]|jgi:NADPH:quinone reductase-like Zn-dependent oxidoreductase
MLCVVINGENLEMFERPNPNPGPTGVIVTVHSFGINAADLMQRRGLYPAPAGWPADIPGMELAGVVSSVGRDVHEPLVGRRVCALVGGGAQATQCAVPWEHLIFVPDHVSWEEAGGFAEAFTTAFDALVVQADLKSGERVLVSGAAGGVGTAAVQIAHVLGAHVIAVTRTNEHHQKLRDLGADQTIISDDVTSLEPVDVVLELLGATNLEKAQHVLAPFARVVVIGVGGGSKVELDLLNVMVKRAIITGSTLRARSRKEKAAVIARVNETLVPLWDEGKLRVPSAGRFNFEDVNRAYNFFAKPGKFGKVIVSIRE